MNRDVKLIVSGTGVGAAMSMLVDGTVVEAVWFFIVCMAMLWLLVDDSRSER